LRVNGCTFSGVTVSFGDMQTYFREPHHGPLTVLRRDVAGAQQTVLVQERSGTTTTLPGSACT
jgi:hypothetical protein